MTRLALDENVFIRLPNMRTNVVQKKFWLSSCRKERNDIRADSLTDSNGGSILCCFSRNGKNIPIGRPLRVVFSDCGRTAVAQGTKFVDWSLALQIVNDDHQLLKEVVQAFLDDVPRLMDEIHRAVETDDAAVLCGAAHSLKGSMLFPGSTPTFELAQQLETCGAEGALSSAGESLVTFEQEMDLLISELRGYFHPDQSHP